MSNTSIESKYPVAIFELIPASKTGAGFVREDTIGTASPVMLIHPKNRVIQSESIIKRKNEKGDAFVNVSTRYVYNQEIIEKNKQEASGVHPNPKTDKIVFINGFLTVPKDGAFVGLYNFMKDHAQNETNPNRPKNASGEPVLQPIFREIKPAEDAHTANFNDFLVVEAISYIKQLVTLVKDKYVYDEERINALCQLFNVYAETPEQKTTALIAFAKANPKDFLTRAKANEQTVNIEVRHALTLKVISFAGNTAMYAQTQTKIKTLYGKLDTEEKQLAALATFFSTVDGKEAYDEFKTSLAAAKEAHTSQQ